MGNEAMERAGRLIGDLRGDDNDRIILLIQKMSDETLTAVIDKLERDGMIDSKKVNTKDHLIELLEDYYFEDRFGDKREILMRVYTGTFFDD